MSKRFTRPCPLGPSCPTGGSHVEGSKTYKEHLARAVRGGASPSDLQRVRDVQFDYDSSTHFSKSLDGKSSSLEVGYGTSVPLGERMTKAYSEYDAETAPPFARPVWMFTRKVEDELTEQGFTDLVAECAAVATNVGSSASRLSELVGGSEETLDNLRSSYREHERNIGREDRVEAARRTAFQLWRDMDMRTEFYQYGGDENRNTVGKAVVSAEVDGKRQSVLMDYSLHYHHTRADKAPTREEYKDPGFAAVASAVNSFAQLDEHGGDATEFVLNTRVRNFGIEQQLAENFPSGGYKGAEAYIEQSRDDLDSAIETMSEAYGEFYGDQKKIVKAMGYL